MKRRYSYDPQWWLIRYILTCCFIVTIGATFGLISLKIGVAVGAFGFLSVLVLILRRLVFPRYLELGQDVLRLPSGFVGLRMIEIPYATIWRMWETRLLVLDMLCFSDGKRTFGIHASYLPDQGSYVDIKDFLGSLVKTKG